MVYKCFVYFDVAPALYKCYTTVLFISMLVDHCINAIDMFCLFRRWSNIVYMLYKCFVYFDVAPALYKCCTNVILFLCWSIIVKMLLTCFVYIDVGPALYKCYTNVLSLFQRWANIV